MDIDSLACCGIAEIREIEHEPDTMVILRWVGWRRYIGVKNAWDLHGSRWKLQSAHILFTDINRRKYGTKLAAAIERHRLGAVVKTKSAPNPNSNNRVTAWLWTPNDKVYEAWLRKHPYDEIQGAWG